MKRKYVRPELVKMTIDSDISLLMASIPDDKTNNGNHYGWEQEKNPHSAPFTDNPFTNRIKY